MFTILRHVDMDAWFEGEEVDPDDGVPHLGAALACLAIIVDSDVQGTLVDDRNYGDPEKFRNYVDKMTEHVSRLQELHKHRDPKHYSIADNELIKEEKE